MIIIELIYNLSILVAISVISGFIDNKINRHQTLGKIFQGILFGITAVIGMMNPFVLTEGVFFDGRSIVISVCTVFFGPVSGFISALISSFYRIYIGGGGTIMGVSVIFSSLFLGLLFFRKKIKSGTAGFDNSNLYLMGILVHVIMLLLVTTLPGDLILPTYKKITLTVIGIYPLITILIGKILSDQEKNKSYVRELSEREKLLRTTLYSIGDGVIATDLEGKILNINKVAESLTGWKEPETLGQHHRKVFKILDTSSEKVRESTLEVVLREKRFVSESNPAILVSTTGKRVTIIQSASPILRDDNTMAGVVLTFRDMTSKIELTHKLKESEHRYQTLAEISPVGIFTTDKNGSTTYVNPQWCKISGLSLDDAKGDGWLKAVHPEDRKILLKNWQTDFEHNSESNAEYRFIRMDGSIAWVIGRAVPEVNFKNEIIGYVGTITDITDYKKTEEALRESEEIFSQFMKYSPIYVFFKDKNIRSLRLSENFEKMLGRPIEKLLNKNMFELFPSDLAENIVNDDKKILQEGKVIEVEEEFDGRSYKTIKFPIHKEGSPQYLAGFTIDVTDQKRIMTELMIEKEKAEKANQLKSEFLAQMSHEIRSPINTIVNFTTLVEDELSNNKTEDMDACFQGINLASMRVIRTIDSILNMSELQLGTYELSIRDLDLIKLLNNLLNEYKSLAERKKLKLTMTTQLGKAEIRTDEYAVNQIFANLIDNAIKYTEKGKIEIILGTLHENSFIVTVKDTGQGISQEYLPILFEPFTQEEQGYSRKFEGNGLGMSLVKKYCELINADISVESSVNKGTTFTIVLPHWIE